jgi:hypothetical protein
MMKSLMNFTFPEMSDEEWKERLAKTHSIRDFQCNFIYHTLLKVLEKSSDGMTTSGFEKLDRIYSYQIIEIYYWIQRYSMWLYSNTVL